MPEKEMWQVKVYAGQEGHICISQPDFGSDDHIIFIHPEQTDLLIKWLQETKAELENDKLNV